MAGKHTHINWPKDGPLESRGACEVVPPRAYAALAVSPHRIGSTNGEGFIGRQIAKDDTTCTFIARSSPLKK